MLYFIDWGNLKSRYYFQELSRIVELPFSNESLICVRPPNMEFAVVAMERSGFACTFCHTGNRSCPHVKCIKSLIDNEPEMVPDFVLYILNHHETLRTSLPRSYTCSAVSSNAIPVKVLPSQVDIFNGLFNSTIDDADQDNLKLHSDVEGRNCPSCQAELQEIFVLHDQKKRLYTLKNIFEVCGEIVLLLESISFVLAIYLQKLFTKTKPGHNPFCS